MKTVKTLISPQLKNIHSGKVRESFRIDDKTRMILVTDKISSFDKVLKSRIPYKGAVLNALADFWFDKTGDIIDNHMKKLIDPNISLVKEAKPIKIEMIIRGYLTGSMWRNYSKGKREFSGIKVGEGLTKNQKFEQPLVTPTTKEESDREITPEDIVKEGWTTAELYDEMEKISLQLFEFGSKYLAEKGIVLVDTKYEFGLVDDKLILIDEIHTPDSSRFWYVDDYRKNPEKVEQIDKEFVRQWLINNKTEHGYHDALPEDVIAETSKRYLEIYRSITGSELPGLETDPNSRMLANLVKHGVIKDGYVAIIMGSPADIEHCNSIRDKLEKYDIFVDMRVVSAHKNGERIGGIAAEYNQSIEPGAVIAVAGRSNGLGGALSANMAVPVINCPPFKDKVDMTVNINSSLMMPSKTPAATVVDVSNATQFALRSLNIPRLKARFTEEIEKVKSDLIEADLKIRSGK